MAKEKNEIQEIPKTIKFKDKLITCPACRAKIQVDFDLDISPIGELAQAFQKMNTGQAKHIPIEKKKE